jgi:hypothetical protein
LDSFARKYLIVMLSVAVLALAWYFLSKDPRVAELNDLLTADSELATYPYKFRVLSLENGLAVLGSPRSAEVPVMQFLHTAFPDLAGLSVQDPRMMAAQDLLVEKQSRAAMLIREQPDVTGVRWTLDERWYAERGVVLDLD